MFNLTPVPIYGDSDGVASLPAHSAVLRCWHRPPKQAGSAWARRRRARSQQTPPVTVLSPPLSQFFWLTVLKNLKLGERERENAQTLRKKKPHNISRVLSRELLHRGKNPPCQVASL